MGRKVNGVKVDFNRRNGLRGLEPFGNQNLSGEVHQHKHEPGS